MKNKLILLVAVLVAVLAFILNWKYIEDERAELYRGAAKVDVIVASEDLPAMTVLTIDDLRLKPEFKSAVGNNAFYEEDLDALLGKRLDYPVKRGDMLLWSQVDMPRQDRRGLSNVVEKGKRAVSLAIAGAPAVSGLVMPNDHVDILGTFTFPSRTNPKQVESVTLTLLQNVNVLATGAQVAGFESDGRRGGYSMMTFSVSPQQAQVLVFAQQTRGQLYLSLRNPDDRNEVSELPSVNFDQIEAFLQQVNAERAQDAETTTP